jgi:hypothetical protein
MAVPIRVIGGRAGNAIPGESLGDGLEALACDVLSEDPPDDIGRLGVRRQSM